LRFNIAQALLASMTVTEPETSKLGRKLRRGSTPNKYQPHQGAREKARRLRRMSVAEIIKAEPDHGAS
jgi:hypothetical protein